jgi:hypothetical protein
MTPTIPALMVTATPTSTLLWVPTWQSLPTHLTPVSLSIGRFMAEPITLIGGLPSIGTNLRYSIQNLSNTITLGLPMMIKQVSHWTLRESAIQDMTKLFLCVFSHHFTLLLLDDKLHLTPLGPNIQVRYILSRYGTFLVD